MFVFFNIFVKTCDMKILILFLIVSFSRVSIAQMNISTDLRKDYVWNDSSQDWIIESSDNTAFTFFKFNKELTMFKHTTATLTSAYVINSSEYDEEKDQYTFDITSDVGNEYLMIIDINNNNIRFISEDEDGTYLVRHNIKRLWIEDK